MDYVAFILRMAKHSGYDIAYLFQVIHLWKYKYNTDISNDVVLFIRLKVVPEYVIDFCDEMERRKNDGT